MGIVKANANGVGPELTADSFMPTERKEGSGSTTLRIVPADYNGMASADSTTHGSSQAQTAKFAHSVHGDTVRTGSHCSTPVNHTIAGCQAPRYHRAPLLRQRRRPPSIAAHRPLVEP